MDDRSAGRGGTTQDGGTRGGTDIARASRRPPNWSSEEAHIVLATEETTVTQQVSHSCLNCCILHINRSGLNHTVPSINLALARGHKEVLRSTGHITVTTRYSDQHGSKSRQKVMRLYKQWQRPISKRFIKPPYSVSRAAPIDSDCCLLPTTRVLRNNVDKLRSNQF